MATVHLVYFDIRTGYHPGVNHGVAALVGALRAAGHGVRLRHLAEPGDIRSAARAVGAEPAHVVGLSFVTPQLGHVRDFLARLEGRPGLVLAGGIHARLVGADLLDELPGLDGCCPGEGEEPLVALCNALDAGRDPDSTPGFVFRFPTSGLRPPGGVGVEAPPTDLQRPPPTSNLPDYSLFDLRRLVEESGGTFPMQLGRGCPFDCHYCCNHALRATMPPGAKYVRLPTVERAVALVRHNLAQCPGTRRVSFADDTLTHNRRWLAAFCEAWSREIGLPFECNARVETVDREVARMLASAGCTTVMFGVETGDETMRRQLLGRPHTDARIHEAFAAVREAGMETVAFTMVGFPDETPAMAARTFELVLELLPDYGKCFYFYPFPGTRLHRECADRGFIRPDIEALGGYLEEPALLPTGMRPAEVQRAFRRLNLLFYARLVTRRLGLSPAAERSLLRLLAAVGQPLYPLVDNAGASAGPVRRPLRRLLRRLALRHR